jgi:serine/threonine protein kinase
MTPDDVQRRTEPSAHPHATPAPSMDPAQVTLDHDGTARRGDVPAQAGKYGIEGEIARGGMGMVLRARDPDLGRTLAVKVLLGKHHGNDAAIGRFLEEAKVCGQLQHPGVPPVHEVGTLPDGRPFFAMKLVKGETLANLLDQRPHPSQELPRFLGIFEQVCQTVAFAHSRNVIHRDLKPANVMVGAFGEVQVMDWGLAKLLTQELPAEAMGPTGTSTFFTSRTGVSPLETQPGTVLGTPSFMPPEQARGQTTHLDARADVFSLGGILCVILTGQPPYTGKDMPTALRQAAEGDTADAFARLDGCGADAELITLAKTCLAYQPTQRPPEAAAVASAVAHHRLGVEQRLRQAEIAQAQAEVKAREERKSRRLTLLLSFMVILALLGAGSLVLWLRHTQESNIAVNEAAQRQEAARMASLEEGYDSRVAAAHLKLADKFFLHGKHAEAIVCLREAVLLDPRSASCHKGLGYVLYRAGSFPEAVASYAKSLELNPRDPQALIDLGCLHLARGNYPAARAALQQVASSEDPSLTGRAQDLLRQSEVGDVLEAVLAGKAQLKDARERLDVACLCRTQHRHALAVRFAQEAYAAEPTLAANDPQPMTRFYLAASAVQAGCGEGQDAAKLTDAQKASLRQQALEWLNADLVLIRQQLARKNDILWKAYRFLHPQYYLQSERIAAGVEAHLRFPNLASVRSPDQLKLLPDAERLAWQRFWGELRFLLRVKQSP